jgi:hypothetical protein
VNMSRQEENFQMARSQYELFVRSLDKHYTEVLKFLAIIVPSLAAFGIAVNQFISSSSPMPSSYFVFVTFAALAVLGWGAVYVLTLSYRFQYLRFIVSKIEEKYELTDFMPTSFAPVKMTRRESLSLEILPEIMKVHFSFFIISIIIVIVTSSLLLDYVMWIVSIPLFGLLLLIVIYLLGCLYFPDKYNKLFSS